MLLRLPPRLLVLGFDRCLARARLIWDSVWEHVKENLSVTGSLGNNRVVTL